jgi:hypothetical protein
MKALELNLGLFLCLKGNVTELGVLIRKCHRFITYQLKYNLKT